MSSVYIRDESAENERRTPLVPKDIVRLIEKGFEVIVQTSEMRIYSDELYINAGAKITDNPWFLYKDALIIGIKELTNLEKLNNHTHMYFSHSYKKQANANQILDAFRTSNSKIYDFEYFVNNQNQRLIAFGFNAGIVGAILGLRQYTNHLTSAPDLENLTVFSDINNLLKTFYKITTKHVNIAIVGANGRCGSGVKYILDQHKIPYTVFSKTDTMYELRNYNLIYNCISLDETYNKVWFDKSIYLMHHITIVDISCDYTKVNNPIALYNKATTWAKPVFKANEYVDIIAIDNLPSLLPKESSDMFSAKCTDLILEYGSETWQKCLEKFISAGKI